MMIFREALPGERELLFRQGYRVWSRNRTFEQYCTDNGREDACGTRYVLEQEGEIVSSAIVLTLGSITGKRVCGIGSVLTPPEHRHNGYATALLENCLRKIGGPDAYVFLYSGIEPTFYRRFGFRILPERYQAHPGSAFMVLCSDLLWEELLSGPGGRLPDYF